MEKLIWKPVVGYENEYHVSEHGDIKSLPRLASNRRKCGGRLLKPTAWECGYRQVALCKAGYKNKNKLVHRIVAEAFLPPPGPGQNQVAHYDGNGANNHVSNLRWATPGENAADKKRHGTDRQGEKHPLRSLNENDIRDIRASKAAGENYKSIAERHNIHPMHVYPIVRGEAWGHVA